MTGRESLTVGELPGVERISEDARFAPGF